MADNRFQGKKGDRRLCENACTGPAGNASQPREQRRKYRAAGEFESPGPINRPGAARDRPGHGTEGEASMQDQPTQASLFDLAWLAGWLEGEGSFYARTAASGYLDIAVAAKSTDLDVLQRVQRIAGGYINGPHLPKASKKPIWSWGVQARDAAVALMRTLEPFMGERRRGQIAAALALEAISSRRIPARHGTISKYNGGCKCDPCRLAQNEYQRNRRRRLREARNAG